MNIALFMSRHSKYLYRLATTRRQYVTHQHTCRYNENKSNECADVYQGNKIRFFHLRLMISCLSIMALFDGLNRLVL